MGKMPTRALPAGSVLLALVTVLALLVAPVCAPLCAARGCSSSARVESCHDMTTMAAGGGEELMAPRKACGSAELSAVLVGTDKRTLVSAAGRIDSAPLARGAAVVRGVDSLHDGAARGRVHRVPLESDDFSVLGTILRI